MMGFREHGVMLYLDSTLYLSFIKLQADKSLGRSYAGLLAFVEGLHQMGYLNEEQYLAHKKRYSLPLDEEPRQLTLEESKKAQERKQLEKLFAHVKKQWEIHKDKSWRENWTRKAREYGDITNAKKLLAFVEARKEGL